MALKYVKQGDKYLQSNETFLPNKQEFFFTKVALRKA